MRPSLDPTFTRAITSLAATVSVAVWQSQPANSSTTPLVTFTPDSGRLVDDASQAVRRTLTLTLPTIPSWLQSGIWLQPTIGVAVLKPALYRLPVVCVTDISDPVGTAGPVTLTAHDPAEVVQGRPYEADTVLTGTLRSLVAEACTTALSRTTDVSGVPTTPLPAGMLAEFGRPRWSVCLDAADALGYVLRFTDAGDVLATRRADPAPAPAATIAQRLTEGGTDRYERAPTSARVLVSRGTGAVGLVGRAEWAQVTSTPLPAWYRPYVVCDRRDGDPTTTQAQADALALDLLRARLADLDTYQDMPIAPAPWLEAGVDTVTFYGRAYWVRAVSVDLPSLATAVTLRRAY
jgi:hypothetical protein